MLIALIIKRYLILVLSAIFSLYIKLHYEITGLLTRILPAATYTSRHLVHTQTMCQDSHRVRFECFIQIIAGSSISLILSLTVINYQ